MQYVASLSELPQALQPYYTQGYVLSALHPIILSVGRTRSLPFSLLYRAILARPRPRYTNPDPGFKLIPKRKLEHLNLALLKRHRKSGHKRKKTGIIISMEYKQISCISLYLNDS